MENDINNNDNLTINNDINNNNADNMENDINNNVDNMIVESKIDENNKENNVELLVEKKIGLTDIFDIKKDEKDGGKLKKEKEKLEYDNIDIFSFFDDAAPFHK
jgi:hypothetical protein